MSENDGYHLKYCANRELLEINLLVDYLKHLQNTQKRQTAYLKWLTQQSHDQGTSKLKFVHSASSSHEEEVD